MLRDDKLADLLEPLAVQNGMTQTAVPGVFVVRADNPVSRVPLMYQPCIIVIAQGRKRVWFGDRSFDYDANNYLVLGAPMPLECETMTLDGKPLLGMTISVDPIMVGELLLEMDDHSPESGRPQLVGATSVTGDVIDTACRLAKSTEPPLRARVLGEQLVREMVFHVLQGSQGDTLRLLAGFGRYGQIARVLRRIHDDYASELDVPSLAREANMGTSTFHHVFRELTATTPLQYIKETRLHHARTLLLAEGLSAQEAAYRVGYASPSQFGREYRRMFGTTPASDRAPLTA